MKRFFNLYNFKKFDNCIMKAFSQNNHVDMSSRYFKTKSLRKV